MTQSSLKAVLKSSRISFLLLTPACISLGLATVHLEGQPVLTFETALVAICALAAHICVNTLNEYSDFKSGLDFNTDKTAFSGGSGALVENPDASNLVLLTAISSAIVTLIIGSYFVFELGAGAFVIGVMGLVIILTYTNWFNRHAIPCLIAPGFCFGPLMVIGTQLALLSEISHQAVFASLVPFFLVNNLLLLNQIPDRAPDKAVGRNHFSIAFGLNKTCAVYGAFAAAACVQIIFGSVAGLLPSSSIIALLPASLSLFVFAKLIRLNKNDFSNEKLMPLLAINTVSVLLTPPTIALGIWIS